MELTKEQSGNKEMYEAARTSEIVDIIRMAMSQGCIRPCHVFDAVNEIICMDEASEDEVSKVKPSLECLSRENEDMLDAFVRISNWCAQDLAECCPTGNYEKTLRGLLDVCRPYVSVAIKLKKYGGSV